MNVQVWIILSCILSHVQLDRMWAYLSNSSLYNKRTSSTFLKVNLNFLARVFPSLMSFWIKFASYEYRNWSTRNKAHLVPSGMPTFVMTWIFERNVLSVFFLTWIILRICQNAHLIYTTTWKPSSITTICGQGRINRTACGYSYTFLFIWILMQFRNTMQTGGTDILVCRSDYKLIFCCHELYFLIMWCWYTLDNTLLCWLIIPS